MASTDNSSKNGIEHENSENPRNNESISSLKSSKSVDTLKPKKKRDDDSKTETGILNSSDPIEIVQELDEEIELNRNISGVSASSQGSASTSGVSSSSKHTHDTHHHHHHTNHNHNHNHHHSHHGKQATSLLSGTGYGLLSSAISTTLSSESSRSSYSRTEHDSSTTHHHHHHNHNHDSSNHDTSISHNSTIQGLEQDFDDTTTTTSSISSYAGSARSHDDEESFSGSGYISDRLTAVLNPQLLDRVIVVQAQTSGKINAKSLEIAELHAEAEKRLEELKSTFGEGVKTAKKVAKDLEWVNRHLKVLVEKARIRYPIEHAQAEEKIKGDPNRILDR